VDRSASLSTGKPRSRSGLRSRHAAPCFDFEAPLIFRWLQPVGQQLAAGLRVNCEGRPEQEYHGTQGRACRQCDTQPATQDTFPEARMVGVIRRVQQWLDASQYSLRGSVSTTARDPGERAVPASASSNARIREALG
jgi:hypothetical protein